jgi:hypothetical protein
LTNPWPVTDWLLAGAARVRRRKKKVAGVGFECVYSADNHTLAYHLMLVDSRFCQKGTLGLEQV